MPYPNYHAARIKNPNLFVRIVVLRTLDNGIMIYGGPLKSNPGGGTTAQTYRFPRTKFTVAQAKTWLRDHDIKWILFEPATGGSQETKGKGDPTFTMGSPGKKQEIDMRGRSIGGVLNRRQASPGRKPSKKDLK